MDLKESLISSFSTLKSNKTRSFLTMLGIIIGISSVIMISTLGKGFQEGIMKSLNEMSKNTVVVTVSPTPDTKVKKKDLFEEEDINYIKKLQGVKTATLSLETYGRIKLKNGDSEYTWIEIMAGNENLMEVYSLKLLYGRNLLPEDNIYKKKVVLIDDMLAKKKFGHVNAVGEELEINRWKSTETYLVVGIVENIMKKFSETLKTQNFYSVIPYNTVQKYYNFKNNLDNATINIKIKNASEKQKIGAIAVKTLEKIKKNKKLYKVEDSVTGLDGMKKILSLASLFISAIAAISLFVGGIGVMNIMLVSVTERTKEIGIRKAIGAKNKDILLQFLIEALTLTLIGGIFGLLIGFSGANLVGMFIKIKPILSVGMTVISVLVSSIIGLIFGVFPAVKASKLNPIDALRHE